jgi:TusA-related sulfurtransferase
MSAEDAIDPFPANMVKSAESEFNRSMILAIFATSPAAGGRIHNVRKPSHRKSEDYC